MIIQCNSTRRHQLVPVFATIFLASMFLLLTSVAYAQPKVGHATMMTQPGVKLIAVEFWADWCKPCVAAIPRWKKLHKKYRDRGFRLIVVGVNTEGRCTTPGWTPDKIVCDLTGEVADAWNAKDLPQAFLWTWQGALLVEHGTIEEVEKRVEQWFTETPRILVEDPLGPEGKALDGGGGLKKLVRNELRRQARFDLVPSDEEAAELRRLRERGADANFDESQACRLGKDISANSALKISTLGAGDSRRLLLELFSLERSCLVASAVAPMGAGDLAVESAAIESVAKLLATLIGEAHQPSKTARSTAVTEMESVRGGDTSEMTAGDERIIRGESKAVDLGAKEYILSVRTQPEGAMVSVDEAPPRSESTRFLLPAGRHTVSAFKEWYATASRTVNLAGNEELSIELKPNWGTISVKSTPAGAAVSVNGQEVGKTPFRRRFQPGGYRVEVRKEMHLTYEKQFNLGRGKTATIAPELEASFGTLAVETQPPGANIEVNGMKVGTTPMRDLKLPPGKVTLVLMAPKYHPVRFEELLIKRGESRSVSEHLSPITGGLKVLVTDQHGAPVPARLSLDNADLGEAPFAAEIRIGTYTLTAVSGPARVSTKVTIEEGEVESQSLTLNADSSTPIASPAKGQPPGMRARGSVLPWVLIGLGGASCIGGATMIMLAANEKDAVRDADDFTQSEAQSRWDDANTLSGWGWAVGGTGAAMLASGIIWKLVEPSGATRPLAFSVVPTDTGFSFGFAGSF